jgi:hypothetical protein
MGIAVNPGRVSIPASSLQTELNEFRVARLLPFVKCNWINDDIKAFTRHRYEI